jgi:hypothetical protein
MLPRTHMNAVFVVILLCGLVGVAFGSPSGLNNIPTADVAPHQVLVLQGYTSFGSDTQPTWFAGFKYGAAENIEVGIDGRLAGPGHSTDPALQLKYRFAVDPGTAIAVGVANLTADTGRNGDSFPYLVVSHDFGPLCGHAGYSFPTE